LNKQYDYIIAGAGCAGLSLLMRLLLQPSLCNKKILVIDAQQKNTNDRTWCFWEKQEGLFEAIVSSSWQQLKFESNSFSTEFSIAPYSYKMIHGLDFYNYVLNFAKGFANVEFKYEKIVEIDSEKRGAFVQLDTERIYAAYVFNSILFTKPILNKNQYYLLQHFTGWVIKTEQPCFNQEQATFMDFTVSQQHGTTFMYVLPISTTTALVEYTLFTEQLLQEQDYTLALQNYIHQKLGITDYAIEHKEFGIIPMTNYKFSLQKGNVINIGIVGGQAKGSSGYAFKFIQKRTASIVDSLVKNNHPFVTKSIADKKFSFYDSVLLQVLQHKKMNGDDIFAAIFKNNHPLTVLQFLDNESNFLQDLKIMSSVPTTTFLPAAIKEMFK
jgi:lycopene beta-cyclase